MAFLFRLLGLAHACLFDASRQKESACGIFRSFSAHRAAGVERSQEFLRSSVAVRSLERVRFCSGGAGGGAGGAVLFLIAYLFGLVMLSAGSTMGLRAPNPRQRAIGSLDSPHAAAGWVSANSSPLKKLYG